MDTIESKCLKLGIVDFFENRADFERHYPFADLIELAKPNSHVLCVARSLFHFLNKTAELKAGLEKGIQFHLACLDPSEATDQMRVLTQIYPQDIESALISLRTIADWAQEKQAEGAIELRFHKLYLPNSALAIETQEGPVFIWDLSFGRDLPQKRVMMLKPERGNLGYDLHERFRSIWDSSECKFLIQRGVVQLDDLSVLLQ